MTDIQAGLTVLTVLVVPYIVQAIKTKAMTGNVARWTAIAVSALCGALTAMASVPLGKGPKRDLGRALGDLVRHIETGASAEERYVHLNFPRFLYIWSAQMGWRSQAKKNGLTRRDLDRRR